MSFSNRPLLHSATGPQPVLASSIFASRILLLAMMLLIPFMATATTYPVTTTADSGAGSLREAIDLANANAGPDDITFSTTGTLTLVTSLPNITEAVTITGSPGFMIASTVSAFQVTGGASDVTIQNMDMSGCSNFVILVSGGSSNVTIQGNNMANPNGSLAINLSSCSNITIDNNDFTGRCRILNTIPVDGLTITNNNMANTGICGNTAIQLNLTTNLLMHSNDFAGVQNLFLLQNFVGLDIDTVAAPGVEIVLKAADNYSSINTPLNISNAVAGNSQTTVSNLTFTTGGNYPIVIGRGNGFTLSNISIDDRPNGIHLTGSQFNTVNDVLIECSTFTNISQHAIRADGNVNTTTIENNNFTCIDGEVINNNTVNPITAENNFYGYDADPVAGDFSGTVDFEPFLSAADACAPDGTANCAELVPPPAAALNFDGINDFVELPNSTSLQSYVTTGELTLEFWIRPEVGQVFYTPISNRIGSNVQGFVMEYYSNALHTWIRYGNSWIEAPVNLTEDVWQHVAVVANSMTGTDTYVNGVLESSTAASGTFSSPNVQMRLGNDIANAGRIFGGDLDEFRIWNRALCAAEVVAQKDCELAGTEPGLVAYYNFNAGSVGADNSAVTTLADGTANGNDGTLTNFTDLASGGSTSNWVAPGGVVSGTTCAVLMLPEISVNDDVASLDFGNVNENTTSDLTYTITNDGNADLDIAGISSDNPLFTVTLPANTTIGAGNSETFMVTFAPTTAGSQSANISIQSNDCDEDPYVFAVLGEGVVPTPATALDFDGVDDYIRSENPIALFGNQPTTVEFWMNTDVIASRKSPIGLGTNRYYFFQPGTWSLWGENSFGQRSFGELLSTNTWTHVAITYDGVNTLSLYLDGEPAATPTHNLFIAGINDYIYIGHRGDLGIASIYYDGGIDEVRVWTQERSAAEILANYNTELDVMPPCLALYYKLNQGFVDTDNSGETIADDTATNLINNGNLNGFALTGTISNWTEGAGITAVNSVYDPFSEIAITGNGQAIADGDNAATSADGTDFGTVTVGQTASATFTITNSGTGDLDLTAYSSDQPQFTFAAGSPTVITAGQTADFTVVFTPTNETPVNATITIANNDCDEDPYSFAVTAEGVFLPAAALNFDGINDFLTTGDIDALDGIPQMTFESWVNLESITGDVKSILGKVTSGDGNNISWLTARTGGVVHMWVGDGSNSAQASTSTGVLSQDTWHHIAAVFDGTQTGNAERLKIYVDGVEQTLSFSGTVPATTGTNSYGLQMGRLNDGVRRLDGSLDEVRIWSSARCIVEIIGYKDCELSGTEADLVAYYDFNQGNVGVDNSAVTTLIDRTSNGHDGTLTGFTDLASGGSTSNWIAPGGVTSGSACVPVDFPEITVNDVVANTDFGDVIENTTSDLLYTITNDGAGDLDIAGISSDNALFSVTLPANTTITAGNSETFMVTFAPTTIGVQSANISIQSNDCDEDPYVFAVIGEGTISCDISITSTSSSDETCTGETDGSISVVAACTTCASITYTLSGDATGTSPDGNFTGLAPGNYTVTIADSADPGCNATDNVTISTAADGENPVAGCQDISVAIGASGSYVLTAAEIQSGSTDNCDDDLDYTIGETVFFCGAIGTPQSVVLTATDDAGNAGQCTATVTVTDGAAPTIVCPAAVSITPDAGFCNASNPDLGSPTVSDNCAVIVPTNDAPAVFNAETTTVTWTADDGTNAVATCTQVVTLVTEDNDLDGVCDSGDLDDDNDGILDTDECDNALINGSMEDYTSCPNLSSAGTINNAVGWSTSHPTGGQLMVVDATCNSNRPASVWSATTGLSGGSDGNNWLGLHHGEDAQVMLDFSLTAGVSYTLSFDAGYVFQLPFANPGVLNLYGVAVGDANYSTSNFLGSSGDITNQLSNTNETWENYSFTFVATTEIDRILFVGATTSSGGGTYMYFDNLALRGGDFSVACDTDNNMSSNHQDTDSDGDGCFDVVEAGHSDPDGDGILGTSPVSVDGSGLVIGEGGYTGTNSGVTDAADITACCDIVLDDAVATDEICPGAEDGTITVTATCTTCTSIEYSIGGAFQASNVFADVAPGTYTVTIQDSGDAGCNATQSVTVVAAADTEAPTITGGCPATAQITLDLCGEASITPSDISLAITDNCVADPTITLSQTDFTGAGTTNVTVILSDGTNTDNSCVIAVTTVENPDAFEITADDDDLGTECPDAAVTFSATTLLANDNITNGATLEVQEVNLANATDGSLVDNGDGTFTFTPAVGFSGMVDMTYVVKTEGDNLFFADNGHFYEFVADPAITWENAKIAAEGMMLNGQEGYMATITSVEENTFISDRLLGNGWIGANDTENEGVWKWVTGPEAGTIFFGPGAAPGAYRRWSGGEPNNLGGEDYGHLVGPASPFGTPSFWNDLANGNSTIAGYIVEYGDNSSCVPELTATGNITLLIEDNEAPVTPTLADITGECEATATAPTTTDNCAGTITGTTNDALTYTAQGPHTIEWTFNDGNGNEIMVNQTVIVEDVTPPTAVCISNLTVNLDATQMASVDAAAINNGSSDNCGTANVSISGQIAYDCDAVGQTYEVTLTVDDGNATSANSTCTTMVTVGDADGNCCDAAIGDVTTTNEDCPGAQDGSITVTATCTTCTSIEYSIGGAFQASNVFADVAPGTYTVTIQDSGDAGCNATQSITVAAGVDTEMPITTGSPVTLGYQGSTVSSIGTGLNGQTFTINNDGNILSLDFQINNAVPTGRVELISTAAPNDLGCGGTVLYGYDFAPGEIVAGVNTHVLPSPIPVNAGDGVALIFTSTSAFSFQFSGSNTYTGGRMLFGNCNNGSGGWDWLAHLIVEEAICAPLTVGLDANGSYTITQANIDAIAASVTDNCTPTANLVISAAPTTYDCGNIGENTLVVSITDEAGLISNCNAAITVEDNLAPITPTLANVTGECEATATAPTTTDNCGTITGTTSDPLTYTAQGTHTIEWTFDDGNGNIITANQNVIVEDVTDPTITCPADMTINVDPGECFATLLYTEPVGADNCAGAITTLISGLGSGGTPPVGTDNVTYEVVDIAGRSAQCTFFVTVVDNETPTVPVLADVTGECEATATAPTTTDNCAGTITGTTSDPLTYTDQGIHTIEWTFDDGNGNVITANQTVIVEDNVAPIITCADDISTNNDDGDCSAYVTVPAPVITDNCFDNTAPAGTQADPFTSLAQAGSVIGAGTFFFDVDGNQFSTFVECGWVMIVSSPSTATTDLTRTTALVPQQNTLLPASVYADASIQKVRINATGGAGVPFDVESDNPGTLANLRNDISLHNGLTGGINEWTGVGAFRMVTACQNFGVGSLSTKIYQACSNGAGLHWMPNINSSGQWVTADFADGTSDLNIWVQAAAPVMSLTNDITGTCDASGTYPVGTTTITWTVTDAAGNMAQCTQDVTVVDAEAPAITCPADVTVVATSAAGAVATYVDPAGTDNCPGAATAMTAGLASGSTFPIGTTPVEFTVTDAANTMTSCTFNVTVSGTAPDILCPDDIIVDATAGACDAAVDFTATETAGIPASIISYSIAPGSVFSVGAAVEVTATATNAVGTDACTFTVTVEDNEDPVITCPPAATLSCVDLEGGDISLAPSGGSTGGYIGIALNVSNSNGTGWDLGQTVTVTREASGDAREYFVSNIDGNDVNLSLNEPRNGFTVHGNFIIDNPALGLAMTYGHVSTFPSFSTTTLLSAVASVNYSTLLGMPSATDNCTSVVGITNDIPATFPINQAVTVTYTATDAVDLSSSCTQIVTLVDNEDPAIPVLADVTGECEATATAPTTTDNCAGTITGTTSNPLTYTAQGTHTIEWTFDDGNGNVIMVNQNVIVDDVTAPATPVLADVTGECEATATAPTTTDNCAGTITGTTTDALTYTDQGTYTIVWTFDDGNDNVIMVNQTVTVDDVTAPATPVLADVTGECEATATAPTTTDNCAGTITGTTTDALTYTDQGTHTIEWTFDDGNGNVITVNQNVIVDDIVPPTVICQDATVLLDANGMASITVADINNGSFDNCGIESLELDDYTFDCDDIGADQAANNYSLDFDGQNDWVDATGNGGAKASAASLGLPTQAITLEVYAYVNTFGIWKSFVSFIQDNGSFERGWDLETRTNGKFGFTLNSVGGGGGLTYMETTNSFNLGQWYHIAGTYDGTTMKIYVDGVLENSSTAENGEIAYADSWLALGVYKDDNEMNYLISGMDEVRIFDYAKSQAEIQATMSATLSGNEPGLVAYYAFEDGPGSSIVSDLSGNGHTGIMNNMDPATDWVGGSTASAGNGGGALVNLTVTDVNGLVSSCAANVFVQDPIAPAIPSLATITGECEATASVPTTTDNCGTVTGTTSDPLTYTEQGTYNITWTFDDGNGNAVTANQTVIVDDVTAPATPTLADVTEECEATATAPTTTDNCAGTIIGTTTDPLTYNAQGTYTITWTFDDGNGNVVTANQNVIVDDVTDPATPVLADVTGECAATATAPTTTDNCAGTITGTTSDPLTYTAQGTHTIVWSFDDGNDNVITVNQTVIVDDVTNPATPTLADVTGECEATATAPTTTDNCAGTITGTTSDPLTYTDQGTHNIEWTFDDGNGNVITVNQTVIVDDVTAPVVTCPAPITVDNDADACGAVVTYTASATDNCTSVPALSYSIASGTEFSVGTTPVTVTADDGNGQQVNCAFNVTVVDAQDPVAACNDITIDLVDRNTYSLTQANIDAIALGTDDNCPGVIYALTAGTTDYDCDDRDAQFVVTITATDAAGLTNACTATVTISDPNSVCNDPPVAVCNTVTVDADANCMGAAAGADFGLNSTDPDGDDLTFSVSPEGLYPLGTTPVTLTVSDGEFSATCTTTITVVDNTAPTAICVENIIVSLAADGTASITTDNIDAGSFDNCGIQSLTLDVTAFDCADVGDNTIELTVTDDAGLMNVCTATVTVEDMVDPVADCQDIVVQLDDSGMASITEDAVNGNSTDACGGLTFETNINAFACDNVGDNIVELTVTDVNGNVSTCTTTVTVEDNIAPVIACEDLTIELDETGNASIVSTDIASGTPTGTVTLYNGINYTGDSITLEIGIHDFPALNTTVGNDRTRSVRVNGDVYVELWNGYTPYNGQSPTLPVLTITQDNPNLNANYISSAAVFGNVTGGGSMDACGIASEVLNISSFDCSNIGINIVELTVTDVNNNVSTCTATVTVEDNVAPVAECQPVTIQLDDTGAASVTAAQVDNGSDDACGIASLVLDITSFDCADLGDNTVELTVTDNNDNVSTCTATVTVEDNIAPTITGCSDDMTVSAVAGDCSALVGLDVPVIDDNCGTTIEVICTAPGSNIISNELGLFPVGTSTVLCIVTDAAGNADTCSFDITVLDTEDPIITNCPADIVVNNDAGECGASVFYGIITASDNCPGVTLDPISGHMVDGDDFIVGTTDVEFLATDAHGNSSTCTFSVTVNDNEDPTFTCPADVIVSNEESECSSRVDLIAPEVLDNCAGDGVVFSSNSTFLFATAAGASGTFQIGTTSVTATASDIHGNTATCTFNVTVNDDEAPLFPTCPRDPIMVSAAADICGAFVDYDDIIIDDNCSGATITSFSHNVVGDDFNLGTTTVTITGSDAAGNGAVCTFEVTVIDDVAPQAFCIPATVSLDANGQGVLTIAQVLGDANDNCGLSSNAPTLSNNSFSCADIGSQTVTVTVTDVNGNAGSCVADVSVIDEVAPTAICEAVTVSLDASGQGTVTAAELDGGSSDICSAVTLSIPPTSFNCSNVGPNNVVLTVADASGNTANCTSIVTVTDDVAPVAVCAPVSVSLDASGNGSISAIDLDAGSNDACGVATYTASQTAFGCSDVGVVDVTLTVTDNNGNNSSCTTQVTVNDPVAPVLTCQDATIELDGTTGTATLTTADVTDSANDACGIQSLTLDRTAFDCAATTSNNVVTLTAVDNNGNSSSCTAIITVVDVTAPTVVCQTTIVELSSDGVAVLTAAAVDGGSTDACGIDNLAISQTDFACSDVGTVAVTLTATDAAGLSSSCTVDVTVIESTNPVAGCKDISIDLDASGNASILAAQINDGSTDACGLAQLSVDIDQFDCDDAGANDVVLTITNSNGNTSTCTAIVTVNDVTAPNAVCQDITRALDPTTGTISIQQWDVNNGSYDACRIVHFNLSKQSFDCSDVGNNVITLILTDANGLTDECTANVMIVDETAPTLFCQDMTVTLSADLGRASITAEDVTFNVTDACGIDGTSIDVSSFDCSDLGQNTVTLTATDVNGNVTNCTATVTVEDNTAPTVVCRDVTITVDTDGNAVLSASQVDGGSFDNCSFDLSLSQTDFGYADYPNTTVTLTATDEAGNASSCVATVKVIVPCHNVDNGGSIGSSETGCGSFDPAPITSLAPASGGGNAPIEYLWLSTTNPNLHVLQWDMVGTGETFDPGTIDETTYYIRCARRLGCQIYEGESNVVSKIVNNQGEACAPGDETVLLSGDAVAYFNNHWVSNAANILGPVDGASALFYDYNDNIRVQLPDELPAGSQVTITWKRRNYGGHSPARMMVYENSNNGNGAFLNDIIYTRVKDFHISSVITLRRDGVNSLWIRNKPGYADFEVDAITYCATSCISEVAYCTPDHASTEYEFINRVKVGGINNWSGDDNGYGDYTNQSTNLSKGRSSSIKLTPGYYGHSYIEYWKVYIDFDQDGEFESHEQVYRGRGRGERRSSIYIPTWARSGETRMRVIMKYGGYGSPCSDRFEGEIEDYTVYLSGDNSFADGNEPASDSKATATTDDTGKDLDVTVITDRSDAELLGLEADMKVYPNPTNGPITVALTGFGEQEVEVTITNQLGQVIIRKTLAPGSQELKLDAVSNQLVPGSYLVLANDGNQRLARQLIVVK